MLREAEHTCLGNVKKYLKTDVLFRILAGYELGESSPGQGEKLATHSEILSSHHHPLGGMINDIDELVLICTEKY